MFVNNTLFGQRRKIELEFQCDVDDENNGESTSGGELTGCLGIYAEKIQNHPSIYLY